MNTTRISRTLGALVALAAAGLVAPLQASAKPVPGPEVADRVVVPSVNAVEDTIDRLELRKSVVASSANAAERGIDSEQGRSQPAWLDGYWDQYAAHQKEVYQQSTSPQAAETAADRIQRDYERLAAATVAKQCNMYNLVCNNDER